MADRYTQPDDSGFDGLSRGVVSSDNTDTGDHYQCVIGPPATTANVSTVPSSTTSGTLVAAKKNRIDLVVLNDSTSVAYVRLGTDPVSATDFSFQILDGETWVMPVRWTGAITIIWASVNGQARVTETSP